MVQPTKGKGRVKTAAKKPKQPNFVMNEDMTLCSAWLNVSLDPIASNGQRRDSFWNRIAMKYNAEKDDVYSTRTVRSLQGHWKDIKEQVSKFEGYYLKVHRENRSGHVDADKTTEAMTLYNSVEAKPFIFLHCWKLLREQPKWTDLQDKASQADTQADTEANDGDSVSHGQGSASVAGTKRPMGRDSSKAAKKASSSQSVGQSSDEFAGLLSSLHVEKLALIREHTIDVRHQLQELIQIDKEKLALKSELVTLKRTQEDERILGIDLNTVTPMQRVMLAKLQHQVLARWSASEGGSASPCR
ncbi:hypothetical protein BAE44_0013764 [Dichanthelium oligosanthes]|uniref:No apical meristem-associated C-terminal domain-containing protein n=1 Tax=Dichanthelium oligosanthes TaxID=888268 RepID=A0A1E5VJE2_9POAL|nr:hypothetical protein BAE44_0013764 [Dichanthelium oligosanthes]